MGCWRLASLPGPRGHSLRCRDLDCGSRGPCSAVAVIPWGQRSTRKCGRPSAMQQHQCGSRRGRRRQGLSRSEALKKAQRLPATWSWGARCLWLPRTGGRPARAAPRGVRTLPGMGDRAAWSPRPGAETAEDSWAPASPARSSSVAARAGSSLTRVRRHRSTQQDYAPSCPPARRVACALECAWLQSSADRLRSRSDFGSAELP